MLFKDILAPFQSSRTLNEIAVLALGVGVYSLLPVLKECSPLRDIGDTPSDLHAALSLSLGLLLVFRTNAAYGRWWEARTHWGALVNCIRNLSMKLATLAQPSPLDSQFLSHRLAEYPRSLMCHLRHAPYENTTIAPERCPAHKPLLIANQLYDWVSQQKRLHRIDGDDLRVIDAELAKLMDVCGACERIARTPIVRSYRIFARQCITLFLITLPWAIANDFLWWTIPLTIVTAYFMIGMEVVAEHVEEPFGYDEDDLDLEGLCNTMEASVNEVFHRQQSRN
jgi:putative membrane protein